MQAPSGHSVDHERRDKHIRTVAKWEHKGGLGRRLSGPLCAAAVSASARSPSAPLITHDYADP